MIYTSYCKFKDDLHRAYGPVKAVFSKEKTDPDIVHYTLDGLVVARSVNHARKPRKKPRWTGQIFKTHNLLEFDIDVDVYKYKILSNYKGSSGSWWEPAEPAELEYEVREVYLHDIPEDMDINEGDTALVKFAVYIDEIDDTCDEEEWTLIIGKVKSKKVGELHAEVSSYAHTQAGPTPTQSLAGRE